MRFLFVTLFYVCVDWVCSEVGQKIYHGPKASEPRRLDPGEGILKQQPVGPHEARTPWTHLTAMPTRCIECNNSTCTTYSDSCYTAPRKEKQALSSAFILLQLQAQRSQVICLIPCSHLVAETSLGCRVFHMSALCTFSQADLGTQGK